VKITKISLQNFRAFDEPFELDLDGGKNLLLHGENGSGKSSIYFALKRFFEERGEDIGKHRNLFSPETRTSYVRVHIKGKDTTGADRDQELYWNVEDGHPLPVPLDPAHAPISPAMRSLLVDGSRRAGFLDYRAMLRTHLLSNPLSRSNRGPDVHNIIYGADFGGLDAQLFDLVSLAILAGVPTTVSGGKVTTLGELMRKVWELRPAHRYKRDLDPANSAANAFNTAFNAVLPQLESKMAEFLNYFENNQLSVSFQPVSLAWSLQTLQLAGAELVPKIVFRSKHVFDHHRFLNEARLSALAICLFLAGVVLSDNDFLNPAHPRFLFLDDALIGLELQNRLPVLSILTSEAFKNYQIFLLTHDRVWFDLARGRLHDEGRWLHRELLADESTGKLLPRQKPSQSDLGIANKHLANGDLRAAAVYARSAFEWKLRKVCERNGIKISFKADADTVGAGVLWDGVMLRQREREAQRQKGSVVQNFVPSDLEAAVETMRSTVLNRLSHTGASGLVYAEVSAALCTVARFIAHEFPK
jgi:energy-coupling factor transporter ATP-binding protein EcfA2